MQEKDVSFEGHTTALLLSSIVTPTLQFSCVDFGSKCDYTFTVRVSFIFGGVCTCIYKLFF